MEIKKVILLLRSPCTMVKFWKRRHESRLLVAPHIGATSALTKSSRDCYRVSLYINIKIYPV